jgi:hypothetical protein
MGLSPAAATLSRVSRLVRFLLCCWSRNPGRQACRFRLFRVRSPLLAESLLFSFPPGTEMFHFPGYCLARLCVQRAMTPHQGRRIAPFGNPRIKGGMRLPAAYRSLPRPSSPSVTKASAISPYSLAAKIGQTGRGMSKPLLCRAGAHDGKLRATAACEVVLLLLLILVSTMQLSKS